MIGYLNFRTFGSAKRKVTGDRARLEALCFRGEKDRRSVLRIRPYLLNKNGTMDNACLGYCNQVLFQNYDKQDLQTVCYGLQNNLQTAVIQWKLKFSKFCSS